MNEARFDMDQKENTAARSHISQNTDTPTHLTIEELLSRDGKLVYKAKGRSMLPMLRPDRDLVLIEAIDTAASSSAVEATASSAVSTSALPVPYDVVLYKVDGKYVLHRVLRIDGDQYLIRGDNTYSVERVPADAVIGVLTGFVRDGRQISVQDRRCRLYVRIWCALYPLRSAFARLRRLIRT